MSTHKAPLTKMAVLITAAVLTLSLGFSRPTAQERSSIYVPQVRELYCHDCHQCENPTVKSPCLSPCPNTLATSGGIDIPDDESLDIVVLDLLSDLYEPVVFDHKQHAGMSVMGGGCSVCHHYSPAGATPPCRSCHGSAANPQNLRQPGLRGAYHRQCLGCHREWSHDTACENCHAQRQPGLTPVVLRDDADIIGAPHGVEPPASAYVYSLSEPAPSLVTFHHDDHTEVFGLQCVNCHQRESCSRCHDTEARVARIRTEPHDDCVSCHQAQTEGSCAFCHDTEERGRFDHARRTGFDLNRFHPLLQCTQCHVDGAPFSGLDQGCVSCHQGGFDPEAFEHARTGTTLDELHAEVDCEACHEQGLGSPARCGMCHEEAPKPFKKVL